MTMMMLRKITRMMRIKKGFNKLVLVEKTIVMMVNRIINKSL